MRCLERVRTKTPKDVDELLHDLDLQDVLVLNLSRAVQLCVDIAVHILSERKQPPPETMGKALIYWHKTDSWTPHSPSA